MKKPLLYSLFVIVLFTSIFATYWWYKRVVLTKPAKGFSNYIETQNIPIDSTYQIETVKPISPALLEISGMIPNTKIKNNFWIHEDSGCKPELWLYNENGIQQRKFTLSNIEAIDYEEIAYSTDPISKVQQIYLADIGDNLYKRKFVTIYRFTEPTIDNSLNEQIHLINNIEKIIIKYPNITGDQKSKTAQNAEALIIDPISHHLYIFSKSISQSFVFELKAPFKTNRKSTPNYLGELYIEGEQVTAADISPDGSKLLLKTYNYIFLWERDANEPIKTLIQKTPKKLFYKVEPQGEAICWSLTEDAFYTVSEKRNYVNPVLYKYARNSN